MTTSRCPLGAGSLLETASAGKPNGAPHRVRRRGESTAARVHGMTFATPASVDNAYAAMLIGAAVNRKRLAHD